MGSFLAGINLDYLPHTNQSNIDGALYNPAALNDPNKTIPGGQNESFFTAAILVMNFETSPTLNISDRYSPFVRMQNVGLDGEGSLKLPGTPIPEPATVILLGIGILGLAGLGRRKFRK